MHNKIIKELTHKINCEWNLIAIEEGKEKAEVK